MSQKYYSRRQALKALALAVGIPLLESVSPFGILTPRNAFGAPAARKRFIGCFFGAGASMPNGDNGDWAFGGALSPLEAAGHKGNTLLLRGFHAVDNYDIHWSSTAGFLSCKEIQPIVSGQGFEERGVGQGCGKTFDQYVAEARATNFKSISVAWEDQNYHDSGQARTFGMGYVNNLSWKTDSVANGNIVDPMAAFTRLFSNSVDQNAVALKAKIARQQSVLDGFKAQYGSFQKILSGADQRALASSLDSFRELEKYLASLVKGDGSCGLTYPNTDGSTYEKYYKAYNRIIVRAMQCDTISAATIMYHNGIGDNRPLDGMVPQHQCAHHKGDAGMIDQTKRYSRMYVTMLADLVTQLKAAGLMGETLVLLGSNMSDGDNHINTNLPLVLMGEGGDIKFGQEHYVTQDLKNYSANRSLADLYMDLAKCYGGLGLSSYGEQRDKSTGQTTGIFT